MFLTCKNLCFCAGDAIVAENLRYRKFPAISSQPKTRSPENTCWRRLPAAPIPAMPQPWPFSKAKSVCFRMSSNSRIKPRGPRPRTPKNTRPKTRVGGDARSPPAPQCHSPVRFLKQKAYVFACTQTPDSEPQTPGPSAQTPGPWLQAPLGPWAEAPGLRAQGPSSELQIQCPLPGLKVASKHY